MSSPTIKSSISTAKPSMPTGISMALKMFGIEPNKIQEIVNLTIESGMIEKIIEFPKTIERFERKLDAIIKHFSIEI